MLRPHAGKTFPSLADFIGVKSGKAGKPVLDTDTAMRRWVAVTAAAQAQQVKKPKR